jgi:hypothetical protein
MRLNVEFALLHLAIGQDDPEQQQQFGRQRRIVGDQSHRPFPVPAVS